MRRKRKTLHAVGVLALSIAAIAAAPAGAIPCRTCPPDEPPVGGGGGGPQPVHVTGTFRYRDSDPTGGGFKMRPIAGTKVEVWRFAPHIGPAWTWAHDKSTTTDANGSISVSFPFQEKGIIYALRVTATNDAAVVWPHDAAHTVPFHQEPGEPDGANIHRTANSAGAALDFSYDFTDSWTPQHFNLAEDVRHARAYALARRHPGETEPIPAVGVQPTSVTGTWYNAPFDTVVINSSDVTNDHVVLHEYAHWLEEQVGSLPWSPTSHNGCTARDLFGKIVNSGGHAWMEGFADYFAQAVDASVPGAGMLGDDTGTPNKARLESPAACSLPAEFTPDTVERFVAGGLWDLYDQAPPADSFAVNEPADTVSRKDAPGGTAVDTLVFQIMDRELDMATSIGGPFPTIMDFRRAWRDRGLSLTALDAILGLNRIPVPAPPPPPPNPGPPAEEDDDDVPPVCKIKPYLPQC